MVEIIKYDYDGDWIIAMVRFEQKVHRVHILQANAPCEYADDGIVVALIALPYRETQVVAGYQ